jgi:hypothetical protein
MKFKANIIVLLLLCLPSVLKAQGGNAPTSVTQDAIPDGGVQRMNLQYSGELSASNLFMLDNGYQAAYDDNVLGATGAVRQGDRIQDISAHLAFVRTNPRLKASIEYTPYYEFYEKWTEYNRLDQFLNSDLSLKVSARWTIRARETFDDQTGTYPSNLNGSQDTGINLGSPSTLNTTVYVPLANQQGSSSRMDIVWQPSVRTSVSAFGSYDFRNLSDRSSQIESLMNTNEAAGGTQYAWRVNEHSTVGLLYLFQRLNLTGDLPAGSPSRLDSQSVLPSLEWHPRPSLEITAFAGPSSVKQIMPLEAGATLGNSIDRQISWMGGGTIAGQTNRSSWFLSAQRLVSDGGGFLAFVVSSSINAGLRRQLPLPGRYDAIWNIQVVQNRALGPSGSAQDLNAQSATFGLERAIHENMTARLGYDFTRQTSDEVLPLGAGFHRNRISFSINYHWKRIPLRH